MILAENGKLLICHRRLFERDQPRYFVGKVLCYDAGIVKVRGFSFVRDATTGGVMRKEDLRTKLIGIATGAFLVYQLPDETDVMSVQFEAHAGELILTDGKQLQMNMAELPHRGHL